MSVGWGQDNTPPELTYFTFSPDTVNLNGRNPVEFIFEGTDDPSGFQMVEIKISTLDGSNYRYVGVGRDDGGEKGEFCAIFVDTVKFTISEYSTFWLSETPDNVSVGWDAALERICTYGLFKDKVTKENFWVFNTHYDHIGVLAREKSSELILNKIDEVNSALLPVILMGDLNSEPNSRPIKILKTKLNDALEISSTILYGPTGTFNGFSKNLNIDKRIDYFFTSELETLSYAHIDDRLDDNKHISDHLPIFITIKIITAKKD